MDNDTLIILFFISLGGIAMLIMKIIFLKEDKNIIKKKIKELTQDIEYWKKSYYDHDDEIKKIKEETLPESFGVLLKKKYINKKKQISKIENIYLDTSELPNLSTVINENLDRDFLENNLRDVKNIQYYKNGKKIKEELLNVNSYNDNTFGRGYLGKEYLSDPFFEDSFFNVYRTGWSEHSANRKNTILFEYQKDKVIKKYREYDTVETALDGNGKKYTVCSYEEVTSLLKNKKVTEIFKYKSHFPRINNDNEAVIPFDKILDKKGYEVFDENGNLVEFKSFWIEGKKEELHFKVNLSYKDGLLVEEIYKDEINENTSDYDKKINYTYNKKRQLIKEESKGTYIPDNLIRFYWYDKESFDIAINEIGLNNSKIWRMVAKELLLLSNYGYSNTKCMIEITEEDYINLIIEKEIKE